MSAKITSLESITIKNPVLQSQENSESDLFTLSLPYKDGTLATTGDVSALSESTTSAINELSTRVNGATQTLVFDTVEDMNEWLSDPTNTENLPVGSNLYIKDLSAPDYWWTGEGVEELETEKVDLTQYVTKTGEETLTNKTIDLSTCFVTRNGALRYKVGNNTVNLLLPTHGSGTAAILDESNTVSLRNKQIWGTNQLYNGTLKSQSNYTIRFPDKNCTLATLDDIPSSSSSSSIFENVNTIRLASINEYRNGKITGSLSIDGVPAMGDRCYYVIFQAITQQTNTAGDIITLTNVHAYTHSEMGYIIINTPFYEMRIQPYTTGGIVLEAKKNIPTNLDISAEGIFFTYNTYPFNWSSA